MWFSAASSSVTSACICDKELRSSRLDKDELSVETSPEISGCALPGFNTNAAIAAALADAANPAPEGLTVPGRTTDGRTAAGFGLDFSCEGRTGCGRTVAITVCEGGMPGRTTAGRTGAGAGRFGMTFNGDELGRIVNTGFCRFAWDACCQACRFTILACSRTGLAPRGGLTAVGRGATTGRCTMTGFRGAIACGRDPPGPLPKPLAIFIPDGFIGFIGFILPILSSVLLCPDFWLNVQVAYILGMSLDKSSPWWHCRTHQHIERAVRLSSILDIYQ